MRSRGNEMKERAFGVIIGLNPRIRNGSQRVLMLMAALCAAASIAVPAVADEAATDQMTDVVVVGAGTGGVSAAIQAARLGAHVALLEETDWVGGQMATAADSTMNEGGSTTLSSGIYAEFLQRMRTYYDARGKSVGTCYWSDQNHCYEPSAIRKVLLDMIEDANHQGKGQIKLYFRERVVKVLGMNNESPVL